MKKKNDEALKKKARKLSVIEGSAYSISDGCGMRYITPFALSLNSSNTHIGLLSSLPPLIGNFSQIFTIKAMYKHSRKKIIVIGAFLQALMWLFVLGIGSLFFVFHFKLNIIPILLVAVYTLLITAGSSFSPLWSSWMNDLVTIKNGRYFGMRGKITGAVTLVSMLIAGFILEFFKGMNNIFLGFIILFSTAFLARSVSAYLFTRKYEPHLKAKESYYFTILQFLKKMTKNNFGRFTLFLFLINLSTAVASPFFAVYMLKNLEFNYISYTLVSLSAPFAIMMSISLWGRFADSYGNLRVMKITSLFIPFIPLFWLFSIFILKYSVMNIVLYLVFVELFSGFVWAGFNLCSTNFIYDAVTRQRMAICFAYSNIFANLGIFLGANIGGIISSSASFLGIESILFIFFLSFILRFLSSILMLFKVREVKKVKKFNLGNFSRNFLKSVNSKMRESFGLNSEGGI